MAIRGVSTTHIVSGKLGDKDVKSISGVPGTSMSAAYIYVNLYVKLAVTDSDELYIALSNGKITQQHMINQTGDLGTNPWRVFLCARPSAFSVTIPSGATSLFQYPRQYSWKDLLWYAGQESSDFTGITSFSTVADPTSESDAVSKGYTKLPFKITDIDITEESGTQTWTGTIYLNFPVVYEKASPGISDAITLASTQVSVDVTTLLPYYPWAIRKSGSWKSCNRDGGSLQIRKGSWQDVLNYQSDTGDSDAHYRDGSTWKRSPLVD